MLSETPAKCHVVTINQRKTNDWPISRLYLQHPQQQENCEVCTLRCVALLCFTPFLLYLVKQKWSKAKQRNATQSISIDQSINYLLVTHQAMNQYEHDT